MNEEGESLIHNASAALARSYYGCRYGFRAISVLEDEEGKYILMVFDTSASKNERTGIRTWCRTWHGHRIKYRLLKYREDERS